MATNERISRRTRSSSRKSLDTRGHVQKSTSQKKRSKGDDYDPWTKFLFVPRTVTFLVFGLLALTYLSHPFTDSRLPTDPDTSYANRKSGVFAIVCVFLGYSAVQGTSSPHLVRPHPSFWKVVHGVMVCYLLFMVFLLFQTVDDARLFLKHLYPELGVKLEEHAYGESCSLLVDGHVNWEILKDTLFDVFVIAHTLGWWGKALILRDYGMLWTVSIAFEFLELTFQHLLPNFNECWWDSWLLDVSICNFIGIVTGMWTVRYFHGKEYNWRGISQQPTFFAKAQRGLMQFTPYSMENFQWAMFSSPKRCLQCFFPAGIILLFEINHFFLKYELWVPPSNPLNTIRLSILFLIAIPGIREYYEFIESDSIDIFHRLGPFAWTGVAIAFVEMLVIIKFGHGMFPQKWPTPVVFWWSAVTAVFVTVFSLWTFSYYYITPRRKMNK